MNPEGIGQEEAAQTMTVLSKEEYELEASASEGSDEHDSTLEDAQAGSTASQLDDLSSDRAVHTHDA